jgi:Ca2+-binding RTX toxin-like protein
MFPRPFVLLAAGALGAVALVVAPTPVASAAPTTWFYPSVDCPLNGSDGLQNCIDHAASGDTIEITQEILTDVAIVNRSLTIKPDSPSLHPQLTYLAIRDQDLDGFRDIDVTVSGLRVTLGVEGTLRYGVRDHVTLQHDVVGLGETNTRGIVVDAESPVDLDVESSYARTTDHQSASLELYAQHASGTSRFRAVGNKVTQHLAPNHDSGSGIQVESTNGSRIDAAIYNNRVWDVVGDDAGGASGIFLYPDSASSMNADLVGNTFDTVGSHAISLRNDVDASHHVTLNVFDNIVSHATGSGVALNSSVPGTLRFHAGYNDFFKLGQPNFYDGSKPGPGNRKVNPRYVDRPSGDLRLEHSSRLIDAGQACTSGGLANLDAAGHGRVAGTDIDMGSYEVGAGRPTGKVRFGTGHHDTLRGTSGRDILCGFGGNDTLRGRGAADFIDGGGGSDHLDGGPGADWLRGGPGRDTACTPVAGDHRASVERTASC